VSQHVVEVPDLSSLITYCSTTSRVFVAVTAGIVCLAVSLIAFAFFAGVGAGVPAEAMGVAGPLLTVTAALPGGLFVKYRDRGAKLRYIQQRYQVGNLSKGERDYLDSCVKGFLGGMM